ncbi:GNAT family N-acetyltransferase [Sphingomonas sp. 1P06PA]|uniref:GNAT family N-acetyltransferase n=1 Tax=Sphingomonas sp. 1P06PA TaxID=554121 RepID=UPI0039A67AEB
MIAIRPAVPADIPALHALIERGYRGDSAKIGWTHEADLLSGHRTDAVELAGLVSGARSMILLSFDGGTLVGCVQLMLVAPGTAYLGMLTVDPVRQAAGLGRQLIAAAEAEAVRRFGASRIEMTVISRRSELLAYYERRGYARTGEIRPFPVKVDPPLDMVVMARPLTGQDAQ